MAGITLAQAEANLAEALTALSKARQRESYSISSGTSSRSLDGPSLKDAQDDVDYWDEKVKTLTAQAAGYGRRTRYVVPS